MASATPIVLNNNTIDAGIPTFVNAIGISTNNAYMSAYLVGLIFIASMMFVYIVGYITLVVLTRQRKDPESPLVIFKHNYLSFVQTISIRLVRIILITTKCSIIDKMSTGRHIPPPSDCPCVLPMDFKRRVAPHISFSPNGLTYLGPSRLFCVYHDQAESHRRIIRATNIQRARSVIRAISRYAMVLFARTCHPGPPSQSDVYRIRETMCMGAGHRIHYRRPRIVDCIERTSAASYETSGRIVHLPFHRQGRFVRLAHRVHPFSEYQTDPTRRYRVRFGRVVLCRGHHHVLQHGVQYHWRILGTLLMSSAQSER